VFVYRLVAEDTIDMRLIETLLNKGSTQDKFLNNLKHNFQPYEELI